MIQGRGRGVERGELKFQNPLQTFISLRILSLEGYSPPPPTTLSKAVLWVFVETKGIIESQDIYLTKRRITSMCT